jgi:hypothetical protein
VLLTASQAFNKTFGLGITFIGIGIIVTVILVYIAVQVRGERIQNREYREQQRPPGA